MCKEEGSRDGSPSVQGVFLRHLTKPKFGDELASLVRIVLSSYKYPEADACVRESMDDGTIRQEDTFLSHSPGKFHIDKGIDPTIHP